MSLPQDRYRLTPPDLEAEIQSQGKLASLIRNILETLSQIFGFNRRTSVGAEESQQNLKGLAAMTAQLQAYEATALKEGNLHQAYFAKTLGAMMSVFHEQNADLVKLTKKTAGQVAAVTLEDFVQDLHHIDNLPVFQEMLERYDLNSKQAIAHSRETFATDVANMIANAGFAGQRAQGLMIELADKVSAESAVRLQSKPLTYNERFGIDPEPAQRPLHQPQPAPEHEMPPGASPAASPSQHMVH